MCGIFGFLAGNNTSFDGNFIAKNVNSLFLLAESRGKEAAGCAILSKGEIQLYKKPISASEMIKTQEFKKYFLSAIEDKEDDNRISLPLALIGHSRLVTNGAQEFNENNQPVVKNGIVTIHNGIIVNDHVLRQAYPSLVKKYDVDTEMIVDLMHLFYSQSHSIKSALHEMFKVISGSASIASLFSDLPYLLLATNTGSLYVCFDQERRFFSFASELYILKEYLKKNNLEKVFGTCIIKQILPGYGMLVNVSDLQQQTFCYLNEIDGSSDLRPAASHFKVVDMTSTSREDAIVQFMAPKITDWGSAEKEYLSAEKHIHDLRRCKKCILPETYPFIEFDDQGVCNYCHGYRKISVAGRPALESFLEKYRRKNNEPDIIVSFSGGRDSSYALHYFKTELKMNPIAYSYDWGMITDLGRRNQARLCGKLGVEHILVSADIKKKREYVRRNVEAWLKKPDLGMIPLFMAGDKQFFYYANKLVKQTGINLLTMAENQLERAPTKAGFIGVKNDNTNKPGYHLTLSQKMTIASYYFKQYLLNPSYINISLLDTLGAYLSYYFIPQNYLYLFNYIKWDEHDLISTLRNEYDWEIAEDTRSTWRIGDGTASFYNYIYYLVAGFTEIDAFRSNQIREGQITREQALELAREENQPRYESMSWYAQTIGFDLHMALKVVHSMPKLYQV